jgi:hypothetical protein
MDDGIVDSKSGRHQHQAEDDYALFRGRCHTIGEVGVTQELSPLITILTRCGMGFGARDESTVTGAALQTLRAFTAEDAEYAEENRTLAKIFRCCF